MFSIVLQSVLSLKQRAQAAGSGDEGHLNEKKKNTENENNAKCQNFPHDVT